MPLRFKSGSLHTTHWRRTRPPILARPMPSRPSIADGWWGQLLRAGRGRTAPRSATAFPRYRQQPQGDMRTACYSSGQSNLRFGAPARRGADILCSGPPPAAMRAGATAPHGASCRTPAPPCKGRRSACYVYNDGGRITYYDGMCRCRIHGFDPNFHFVGDDLKRRRLLRHEGKGSCQWPQLSGPRSRQWRSRPRARGMSRPSKALPRWSRLSLSGGLTERRSGALRIAESGCGRVPDDGLAEACRCRWSGYNAKLLRDQAGNNRTHTAQLDHARGRGVAGRDPGMRARCADRRGPTPAPRDAGRHVFLYKPTRQTVERRGNLRWPVPKSSPALGGRKR